MFQTYFTPKSPKGDFARLLNLKLIALNKLNLECVNNLIIKNLDK
jgi:hypothetical protein